MDRCRPHSGFAGRADKVDAVGRRMIAVVRSGEAFFAIEDVCTHDGARP